MVEEIGEAWKGRESSSSPHRIPPMAVPLFSLCRRTSQSKAQQALFL